MRICLFAVALAVCGPAGAQDSQFPNPTPVDFTQPFLHDGVAVRLAPIDEDAAMPVEVIGEDQLIEERRPADGRAHKGRPENQGLTQSRKPPRPQHPAEP